MTITSATTIEELARELKRRGVVILQLSTMPDGTWRIDLADRQWRRADAQHLDAAIALDEALTKGTNP